MCGRLTRTSTAATASVGKVEAQHSSAGCQREQTLSPSTGGATSRTQTELSCANIFVSSGVQCPKGDRFVGERGHIHCCQYRPGVPTLHHSLWTRSAQPLPHTWMVTLACVGPLVFYWSLLTCPLHILFVERLHTGIT